MTPAAFEFEVYPGDRLGPFSLGSSLWSVLEYLRQQKTAYPQISVTYDDSAPANSPVLLHIRPYLDLLFSPIQQRLQTVSVSHIGVDPPLTLRFHSHVLLSPDVTFRRSDVNRIFGPTYPGSVMRYPGISFYFEEGGPSNITKKSPAEDRLQSVKRLSLNQHSAPSNAQAAAIDLDIIHINPKMTGELERAVFTVMKGAVLHFYIMPPAEPRSTTLLLGQTRSQDVLIDLGPPLRIYDKDDDRMSIHASQSGSSGESRGYFYNYFQYGLDLFFSEKTHILLKIIVHSNVPGSPLFQRYQRCPWEIEGTSIPFSKATSGSLVTLKQKLNQIVENNHALYKMQVDRSESPSISLKEGITQLTGLDGIVFESTSTGDIVSFTLF